MNGQNDPKTKLLELLDLIGYQDNKEEYIDSFFRLCEQQAFVDFFNTLPKDKQEAFIQIKDDKDKQKQLITEYISSLDYRRSLEQATQKLFSSFLDKVIPTLSPAQVNDLRAFIQRYAS